MDIREIRRLRLKWHVEQEPTAAAFARKYGLNESYITQLLNQHRPMGEKSARNLEAAMGLEPYTLDAIEVEMLSPEQQQWLTLLDKLSSEQRQTVLGVAEQFAAFNVPAKPPAPPEIDLDQ